MQVSGSNTTPHSSAGPLAAIGACLLAVALFVLAFAAARAAGYWSVNWQSSKLLLLVLCALLAVPISVGMLVLAYRVSGSDTRLRFQFPIIVSFVAVLFCFCAGEAAIRLLSRPDPMGTRVGATLLQPYDWNQVAEANRRLLQKSSTPEAYYIADADLGWTVGPSRASADGLYFSSAEGLRSRKAGEQYRDIPGGKAIALFGNSFAFSEEVSYEQSLAHHLELDLGQGARILNFGVPGYGVDQALLRLRKEIGSWSPKVAILSFIQDDLMRTGNMYVFLKPEWKIPLSKPRFVSKDNGLSLLNSPTLAPQNIFAFSSVFELPHLDYEIQFFSHHWRRHSFHESALIRYLIGRFPVWPREGANPNTSDEALTRLGTLIVESFGHEARKAGAVPIIVYFPNTTDYTTSDRRALTSATIDALDKRGIKVLSIKDCLGSKVPVAEMAMPGGHYTDKANRAVSQCLAPMIAPHL